MRFCVISPLEWLKQTCVRRPQNNVCCSWPVSRTFKGLLQTLPLLKWCILSVNVVHSARNTQAAFVLLMSYPWDDHGFHKVNKCRFTPTSNSKDENRYEWTLITEFEPNFHEFQCSGGKLARTCWAVRICTYVIYGCMCTRSCYRYTGPTCHEMGKGCQVSLWLIPRRESTLLRHQTCATIEVALFGWFVFLIDRTP